MLRVLFLVVLFLLLYIKETFYFLPIIVVLWAFSKKDWLKINKKVIFSILFFNLAVTVGYVIMSYIKDFSPWEYLLYINTKVYTTTFFVLLFFERVNVVQFIEFSKTLSYLLTITLSMIYSYKKTFEEFRLSIKARGGIEDMGFLKRVSLFFFQKAMVDSKQRALAMRARGFFDDRA